MAIRILSSENITGNITLYHPSNAPYINFVENTDTSDSKARITMDQVDTNNGTLLFATENAGTLYNQVKITQTGNLLLSNDAASFNTSNAKLNVLPASSGVYQQWNYSPSNENFSLKLKETVTSGNVRYVFEQINDSTTYPNILVFNSGNVGIGTDEPNFKLGLSDSNALAAVYQQFTNGTTGTTSSDGTVMGIDADGDFLINNQEAKEIKLYTSDTQRLTIDSSGRVGIGVASPNAGVKLEVNGIISANGDQSPTGGGLGFGDYQTGGYKWIQSFESQELRINPLGNSVTFPASSVAIGTTNTTAGSQLTLRSSASTGMTILSASNTGECFINFADNDDVNVGQIFYGHSPDRMVFRVNDDSRMTINSSGNVGIGTTSPSGKLEVAGGNTLGFRLSNTGDQSAYDQVRMTYTGYNSGAPTVTFMPLTTPGSGNAYTTFHFSNTNGINASSNNNANVDIDGNLTIGNAKGLQETILTLRNYDANLASTNTIQASLRMSGRYWSGATSQLVETRINSVHQESDGNGGSALTFMTQTGGDGVVEQMRIDKVGNVGIGTTSPNKTLTVYGGNDNGIWIDSQGGQYTSLAFGHNGTEKANIAWDNTNGYTNISTYGNGHLALTTGGGIKAFLNYSGNFGIGITNPAEKLHVNGKTILQNTEYSDYAAASISTTGVVVATVPSSTNGQSVMITFEATGGTGSVYSVIYSCYNGGGNWYYTKNVLIFGGNIEVAETNGSGSSTLSFSFRATSGSAAYTPRVVMKGNPYGLVSFI